MLKQIAIASLTALTALTISSLQAPAQTNSTQTTPNATALLDLNRAKNLARQAAESANGGLGVYRAESSMHGPARESPYVDNGNGTWTFTFKGSQPGSTTPTIESVVTVSQDGRVIVDYNGAIRSTSQ